MSTLAADNLADPITAHMGTDYTALHSGQTVGEALGTLRTQQLGEKIIYFYVLDDRRRLVGVVPTRRLLMSMPDARIGEIMVRDVISIPHTMSVLDACEFFVMHRLLAFPVVNADNQLLGVVDARLFTDEMFDVSERQSANDVFQLIGVRIAAGRRLSPFGGFVQRLPWLLCNITGGVACAVLAGHYERFLKLQIVLALFIPVVLALAESVSMQSMTLTLQSFHGEHVDWRSVFRNVRLESATASLLGAACGTLVGLIAWGWKRDAHVALAIGVSIALAILTACVLGALLPTLVRVLKGDPQIAAGPIVLAASDILTLLFYFNLAMLILR
jgi:magnesium transporter